MAANILILLNIVIALMSDTYNSMTLVRRGLYNYNIVQNASSYKMDKRYSGLIILMPPLCILGFLLVPCYICIKDKKRLEEFNTKVISSVYFFVGIINGAFFVAFNTILMPFAFIKICWHKINLIRFGVITWQSGLFYFLYGLPLLMAA